MPILKSYYQDVYRSPVVRLDGYSGRHALAASVLAYLDFGGATGTSKDGLAETMLAFAAHVMTGDMENNDLTTERTFEQIYSFIAPHFRAELTEGAGKETAVL